MKKYILLLIIPFLSFGQGWEIIFESEAIEAGHSVQQTTDGGYIITGFKTENKDQNIYLIKTDENGIEQWSQTFGGWYGYSVQQTTDGGYIICGYTGPLTLFASDVYVIKIKSSGTVEWSQTYGGIYNNGGHSIQQTSDGGYIITGKTTTESNNQNVYLIKIDENGIEQWSQIFGGIGNDIGWSIIQTTDGGYIITGHTTSFGNGSYDIYLIKTDSNGQEEWWQTFGGPGFDSGYSIKQTNNGGYIICGGSDSFENGQLEVCLIKTDSSGQEEWWQTFVGQGSSSGNSVQQTTDGGYIITGYTYINGTSDVYLIKTDGNGEEQWSQTFGGIGHDIGHSVKQTTDGGYIITGSANSNDVYLIKTDGSGNITSTIEIPTPSPNRKLEKTIDVLGKEINSKTNIPLIEIYDDGSVQKKYVIE